MEEAQKLLVKNNNYIVTFDDRPGKLFDDLEHIRATIFFSQRNVAGNATSRYNRWATEYRPHLLKNLHFEHLYQINSLTTLPKIGNNIVLSILNKLMTNRCLMDYYGLEKEDCTVYFHNAPQYFTRATSFQPYFWNEVDGKKLSVSVKSISCTNFRDAKKLKG
jgi:hypothetical protein